MPYSLSPHTSHFDSVYHKLCFFQYFKYKDLFCFSNFEISSATIFAFPFYLVLYWYVALLLCEQSQIEVYWQRISKLTTNIRRLNSHAAQPESALFRISNADIAAGRLKSQELQLGLPAINKKNTKYVECPELKYIINEIIYSKRNDTDFPRIYWMHSRDSNVTLRKLKSPLKSRSPYKHKENIISTENQATQIMKPDVEYTSSQISQIQVQEQYPTR